jgi:ATP-binding cassette subfamily G (WHITE) protein 2
VFFGLLLGFIYYQLGRSQTNIQDRKGILFFVLINGSFGQLASVQFTFPVEKDIVGRERQGHLYHISAYYISKVASEIPIKILFPLINATLLYWIAGLKKEFTAYVIFVVIMISVALCATAMGLAISALAPTVSAASAMSPSIMIIFLLFGGFYANMDTVPVWLRWLQWISFVRYAFEALMINEFVGQRFDCTSSVNSSSSGQCLVTGEDVLHQMTLSTDYAILWRNVGLIGVLATVFHIMAFVFLRRQSSVKRLNLPGESP